MSGGPLAGAAAPPPRSFWDGRRLVEAAGFKWLLDPGQLIDGAIAGGAWEKDGTRFVRARLRPGMVAADVGANIGYYAVLMGAAVGPAGRVVAFEPMADPAAVARAHLALNGLANVLLLEHGLDEADDARDAVFGYSWDGWSRPPEGRVPLRGRPACRFRRLDDVVAELGLARLDLVKVDVDAYEARLLRGARATLARLRPTLLLEVCDYALRAAAGLPLLASPAEPGYGVATHEMLDLLAAAGYRLLREDTLAPTTAGALLAEYDLTARSVNVVAEPPGR